MTSKEALEVLKNEETIELIKSNYPSGKHILIISAIELAIKLLEEESK